LLLTETLQTGKAKQEREKENMSTPTCQLSAASQAMSLLPDQIERPSSPRMSYTDDVLSSVVPSWKKNIKFVNLRRYRI
jgi:hypothetical protein